MIPEIGHFSLLLAAFICIAQLILPFACAGYSSLTQRAIGLSVMQFTCVSISLIALLFSYASSDFSVYNVFANSHSAKPFIYKLTGTWGNHEGSILLWAWILSLYGYLLARNNFAELTIIKPTTLAVQAFITLGFLSFILLTSNPFARIFPVPLDGEGLNPLLQDIGLAIHPPLLYLGYVGYGAVFSLAIAGLLHKRTGSDWAKLAQPLITLTWAFLTAGIALGSWWAYRELGWGGWWFWDPVENVSLMPWLVGTALLHTNMILEKRGRSANWVMLLAILTFSLSLIGTFIVRSGLLTSVHAFASDPERGIYILGFFAVVTGGAFAIWAWRAQPATNKDDVSLLSKEGFILGNNILLLSAMATILLATLYPLFADLFNLPAVSIGPPYFNQTVLPLLAPLALMSALAPQLSWHKGLGRTAWRLIGILSLSCLCIALCFLWAYEAAALLKLGGILLGAWLIMGTLLTAIKLLGGVRFMHQRVRHLPVRQWGMLISHAGVGILIIAITLNTTGKSLLETPTTIGETHQFAGYDITYQNHEDTVQDNFLLRRAKIHISQDGNDVALLSPETRFYPVRQMLTTEAAINRNALRDLYVVIGQAQDNMPGIRFYIEPAIIWLWVGFIMMAAGGFCAWFGAKRKRSQP